MMPGGLLRTREDLRRYRAEDARMNGLAWRPWHVVNRGILHWLHLLRLVQFWSNQPGPLARVVELVYRVRYRRQSERLGFDVGPEVAGPGFAPAHSGLLVIDPQARIGARCRIHQGVTLARGRGGAPVLGDDVSIGANAVLVGNITLGDRSFVGANAVVTIDVPADHAAKGNPATVAPTSRPVWSARRRQID